MTTEKCEVIGKAHPHTIKKFELVEAYIETWAQKLLQNPACKGIVFIDCMCNSGVYEDDSGNEVFGTPIRVSRILRDAAGQYPRKKIFVYLNDNSPEKIEFLKQKLPQEKRNFRYSITVGDGNDLLKKIGPQLPNAKDHHFFLFYDPFEAAIDWEALAPFFRSWGEVLINHMLYDSVRAIKQVKSQAAIKKYEDTYLADFEDLLPCGSDKTAYEKRVEQIIRYLKGSSERKYYVGAFPIFNTRNSLMYDLVHCTSNIAGFKLYKSTAWKVFGGKSSTKNTHGQENQIVLDFDNAGNLHTKVDEYCYYVKDIIEYLQEHFRGQTNVPLDRLWELLDAHPVFPADGYRNEIKVGLKENYGARTSIKTISFTNR